MSFPVCPYCRSSSTTAVSSEGQFGYTRNVRNCTDCGEDYAYWVGPDDDGRLRGKT